jgi:outer membrane murein-binding lipoprotein Lpp
MMKVARRQALRLVGAAFCFGCMLSVTGCDYWPPALQAEIEQLRSETQTLATEKAQLQTQVNELSKAKQDLLAQIDTMSRVNREKTEMITSLQHQVDALRAKPVKTMASPKKSAKPATKSVAKQPVTKKAATKR